LIIGDPCCSTASVSPSLSQPSSRHLLREGRAERRVRAQERPQRAGPGRARRGGRARCWWPHGMGRAPAALQRDLRRLLALAIEDIYNPVLAARCQERALQRVGWRARPRCGRGDTARYSRAAQRDGCGCWSGECRARAACGCHENTTEPLPCCLASSVKSFFCARGGAEVYGVCVCRVLGERGAAAVSLRSPCRAVARRLALNSTQLPRLCRPHDGVAPPKTVHHGC